MKGAITAVTMCLAAVCVLADQQPPIDDFPVAKLEYKGRAWVIHLHSPFGFVAKWETDGKPTFYLYSKRERKVSVTRDLQVFLDGLSKTPEASEVSWINTCGAPLHYGMPIEMLSKIESTLKAKHFKMAGIDENNFAVCTCEATNLFFFATALPQ